MPPPTPLAILKLLDIHLSTYILIGCVFQTLLFLSLPTKIAGLPAVVFLSWRIFRTYLIATGVLPNPASEGVIMGRASATMVNADGKLSENGGGGDVTVLVLGVRSTHALGMLSPGMKDVGDFFMNMWEEANADRENSGLLTSSPGLRPTDGEKGISLVFLSYWRSLDDLRAFAQGEAHRKGWNWWDTVASKNYPHIGIMHEIFSVPRGSWENIYVNFPSMGMGNMTFPVKEKDGKTAFVSGLRVVKGPAWKSSKARMGGKVDLLGG
ncbi:hypothetical protein GQ43DRAFT_463192 [Delitschia confertaspora ATCC 74209]|uniref:Uncharacterized protein n=1 Tax=Delitschia confertaspora ATCC 74209 TaxID=1513339 RepID=A0A9P4MQ52_9PLEO|nr:hypothetical protein GQ43DRAFT_463192 [Delitschia confertaspora ATCC 74209]